MRQRKSGRGVTVAGEYFSSIKLAAEKYNIPYETFRERLNTGWTPEQAAGLTPPPHRTRNPETYIVDRKKYHSINHLSEVFGLRANYITKKLRQGFSAQDICKRTLPKTNKTNKAKEVTVAGKKFNSQKEAADFHKVNPQTFASRLSKGWTPESAAGLTPKKLINES